MKKKIAILAIDDSPHKKEDLLQYRKEIATTNRGKSVSLIGVTVRGLQLLHVDVRPVEVDGTDATIRVKELYDRCPIRQELRLILINSPTVAGFNVINPYELFEYTKVPVLFISERKPQKAMVEIYKNIFPDRTEIIQFLSRFPPVEEIEVNLNNDPKSSGKVYFHCVGITKEEVVPVLKYLSHYSAFPEPLRLAHIIASVF